MTETNIFNPESIVTPKSQDTSLDRVSEREINVQQAEVESRIRRSDAETGDIKAKTWLKIALSVFMCLSMVALFVFQSWALSHYFSSLDGLHKEVPDSVIIAILTTASSVLTLMGFILKGLFGSNE